MDAFQKFRYCLKLSGFMALCFSNFWGKYYKKRTLSYRSYQTILGTVELTIPNSLCISMLWLTKYQVWWNLCLKLLHSWVFMKSCFHEDSVVLSSTGALAASLSSSLLTYFYKTLKLEEVKWFLWSQLSLKPACKPHRYH